MGIVAVVAVVVVVVAVVDAVAVVASDNVYQHNPQHSVGNQKELVVTNVGMTS